MVAIDSLIIEGYSTLNEAPITGESMLVEKTSSLCWHNQRQRSLEQGGSNRQKVG